ncbi:ATP-binding protein [Mycolicibacterium goodii]|uniref:ATP-binding protein n=1 Tax=Mycolicibacterium goodii TaxID=134601 RepID=UPI00093ECC7F|nr:ATP-binding protein [Mycolicibacterium goodii]MBU8817175.1 ATP-binding protein [Mycolicibacterium goodii]MBU8827880.1 ATP-binding protein [Mycolicibacterium goodii]OKH73229.1 anti-sigma regulatory factor [Mycobacterium sp. SWH-M5]
MTDAGESTSFNEADIVAVPERAAQLRREFSEWLGAHLTLDPVKASDVVLAVNEALANAAEFAYSNASQPGVMHVRAEYDTAADTLTVVVADEGAWRIGDTDHKNPARGRGIPLMHALSDRAVIDATPSGTQVRLQWHNLTRSVASELR